MIRLVVFDLDDTLIGRNLTISPGVRTAIGRAQKRGVNLTIATGRGPAPTTRFARELDLAAPLICLQGGLIYDRHTDNILHDVRLDPAIVPFISNLARRHGWRLHFELADTIYLPRWSRPAQEVLELLCLSEIIPIDDPATDLPSPPHKFDISVSDPAQRPAVAAKLAAALKDAPAPITVVPSHPLLVEGLPCGLNKGMGVKWLAENLGLDRTEVMTVGDNDNDVEMLRWAGIGVAMGNASPAARAAADWIAPDVDGAAAALEKFVLNGRESYTPAAATGGGR